MATRISNVIVPEVFNPYVATETAVKSKLVRSGGLVNDQRLSELLSSGGLTFNQPFWHDLANVDENISNDDPTIFSTPNKIEAGQEVQVRLSRNNSWSSMYLTSRLAGEDTQRAIADRVVAYWVHRLQEAYVATISGVFASNAAGANDMTYDISGAAFQDGVTNFSTEAFINACLTMGDSMDEITLIMVNSIVYARMLKNNLIEFIPDSANTYAEKVPTFLGRTVVVDDGMPFNNGVFESWLFGAGSTILGTGTPAVPTEIERIPAAGLGGGQEVLYNRVEWCIHPVGFAYVGTPPPGGPNNTATANNLRDPASWRQVFPERKQIKIARLITREF